MPHASLIRSALLAADVCRLLIQDSGLCGQWYYTNKQWTCWCVAILFLPSLTLTLHAMSHLAKWSWSVMVLMDHCLCHNRGFYNKDFSENTKVGGV